MENTGIRTIDRLPKIHKKKIESVSDERSLGNGIWIYLKDGFLWDGETSQVHENTVTEAVRELKQNVFTDVKK